MAEKKRHSRALAIIAVIVAVVLLLPFTIYIPFVQSWACRLIEKEASAATGWNVMVGGISLDFPLDLAVNDVVALDNADTIIGNCDSSIFLGGKEPTTLKELNQSLGKETIDTYNTGESRGREVSHSLNYQKLGKDLASIDELAVLDGGKCILQLRGVRPFLSDKYDITRHPNYKYLSDADPRNNFDIEKYLSTRLKAKPDEVYEIFEIDESAEQATA